ncbi:cupin-like domain-containing protein (plasmid) [Aquabacterium sp. OR-4]|nr:cupin-like domain-containing protein [Aquabacterium sp. OR-4]MDT7839004.1 cupin-like domain-containing protein [Aquabacterium sp. OR-4]
MTAMTAMRELHGLHADALPEAVLTSTQPLLLRGLVAHWPVARAGLQGPHAVADYLRGFGADAAVGVLLGPPEIGGRFFYNDSLTGMNFRREGGRLGRVLDALLQLAAAPPGAPPPPALYVGSTSVDSCLPGFRAANDLGDAGVQAREPLASLWLGNRTRIAAHFDLPDNIACVVAGRRRFTLFPPEAVADLYVGPLDLTPAGQAISLVDMAAPDFERFPRFAKALQVAQVAELAPGDAIFIPSLWWHQVEALEPFNVLVNYWWRQSPAQMDSPMATLLMALLTLRDLPPAQREAWRALFSHYVFDADGDTAAHIAPHARSVLAPLDAGGAQALRQQIIKRLTR